jgi:paired amphipathic helix protein Sin3a
MQRHQKWQYYIASYIRVEPTEGVPRAQMKKTVLARNLPKDDGDNDEGYVPKPISYDESLVISICLNSAQMVWNANSSEYFIYDKTPKDPEEKEKLERRQRYNTMMRETKLNEMVLNNAWMKDRSQDQVKDINESFVRWAKEGVLPESSLRGHSE